MQIAVGIHQMLDFQFQVQLDCSQMLENPCDWRWPSSAVNYSASLRRAEGERPSLKKLWRWESSSGSMKWSCSGRPRSHWRSYMTLEHKTSHKGQFSEIEIFIISKWAPLMYGLLGYDNIWMRYNYLKIWNLRVQKNPNIEKITFKVVQMKFLAMHITNQKLSFDIFTIGNLQNIFMEHDLYSIS